MTGLEGGVGLGVGEGVSEGAGVRVGVGDDDGMSEGAGVSGCSEVWLTEGVGVEVGAEVTEEFGAKVGEGWGVLYQGAEQLPVWIHWPFKPQVKLPVPKLLFWQEKKHESKETEREITRKITGWRSDWKKWEEIVSDRPGYWWPEGQEGGVASEGVDRVEGQSKPEKEEIKDGEMQTNAKKAPALCFHFFPLPLPHALLLLGFHLFPLLSWLDSTSSFLSSAYHPSLPVANYSQNQEKAKGREREVRHTRCHHFGRQCRSSTALWVAGLHLDFIWRTRENDTSRRRGRNTGVHGARRISKRSKINFLSSIRRFDENIVIPDVWRAREIVINLHEWWWGCGWFKDWCTRCTWTEESNKSLDWKVIDPIKQYEMKTDQGLLKMRQNSFARSCRIEASPSENKSNFRFGFLDMQKDTWKGRCFQ